MGTARVSSFIETTPHTNSRVLLRIAFVGIAYSECSLLTAFEQTTHVRLKKRANAEAFPATQTNMLSG